MITHPRRHRGRPRRIDLLHSRAVDNGPTDELLVAIEDIGSERGVLSIAELLARRDRINVHLIGVDNPRVDATLTPRDRADLRAVQQNRLLGRTHQLLHRAVGRGAFWTTDAALGTVARVLAKEARKGQTRLVLVALPDLGARRPGAADTLVRITSTVDVPLMAVPRHQEVLPTRVLVATDFTRASIRAARIALSILGPRGHVTLLHVEPELRRDALPHSASRHRSARRITGLFGELRHELDEAARASSALHRRRTSIVNDTVLLRGDAAPTILEYAAEHLNDLLVLGTRRVRADDTLPLGSVSRGVLHGAQSAVLLAPPAVRRRVAGPSDPFFKAHHTAT